MNFQFKKKYGQNFIKDKNIINNIVDKANIDKDTLVIEIGPGMGALTYELGKVAKNVIAYEIDESLKEYLYNTDNIQIIYHDFLKRDVVDDLKKYEYKKLYVVANLPYYITTPIIIKIIEELNVDKMVLMVQKEVGNRFKANHNTKEYNSLSIFLKYYFNINKIMDISKNVFIPKPKVDSIILEFTRKKYKLNVKNEEIFFKLIKDSFKQKRKTIKNNLKDYDLSIIENVLKKYDKDLSVRAESLPIEVFIDIANHL